MRHRFSIGLAVVLVAGLALGGYAEAQQRLVLKFAHITPTTFPPRARPARRMIARVAESRCLIAPSLDCRR